MINEKLKGADFSTIKDVYDMKQLTYENPGYVANCITAAENGAEGIQSLLQTIPLNTKTVPILGITGTGGAGKSSLTDELIRRFLNEVPNMRIAILSVDPTKQKTGGALLGDRIRMNAIFNERIFMRS